MAAAEIIIDGERLTSFLSSQQTAANRIASLRRAWSPETAFVVKMGAWYEQDGEEEVWGSINVELPAVPDVLFNELDVHDEDDDDDSKSNVRYFKA